MESDGILYLMRKEVLIKEIYYEKLFLLNTISVLAPSVYYYNLSSRYKDPIIYCLLVSIIGFLW